ncbi:MAG: FKBP-type peptidyl-prolyl cis-trans isomerase [Deltaproteobacteria bacterium]|nr:MAG: FKBP-type peptidyl-prolyl cis-trans isomerase [Deltaproteobacteria bacterium]
MKKVLQVIAATTLLVAIAAGCTAEEAVVKLDDAKQRISYTIGLNIGRDFTNQSVEVDTDALMAGIRDGLSGQKPRLSDEQMLSEVKAFRETMVAKQEAKLKALAEKNKTEGEAFLAKNAKEPGVTVTQSGLQYKVLKDGAGPVPKADAIVSVHYRGTLLDGTEFDSSYERNEPLVLPVGGVIPGWTEALGLMKEGSKWQLFIPAALAYGEEGAPPAIGPNAVLKFEVELISAAAKLE